MRSVVAICLLLCGCVSDPFKSENPATLVFLGVVPNELGGVYRVDGYPAPGGVKKVAPGKHEIEYSCPGYFYTDNAPTIKAVFEPGKDYEMLCEGTQPIIRIKQ